MTKIYFLIVFFFSSYSFGQNPFVPAAMTKIILAQCPICFSHPQDSLRVLSLSNGHDSSEINYHNCHVYFHGYQNDSTFKFALQTIAGMQNKKNFDRMNIALYMKAKILFRKHLYPTTLEEYLNLLNKTSLDVEIKSNITSNIGEIYLDQKDYINALQYLKKCIESYPQKSLYTLKSVYSNIGLCYLLTKNNTDAEIYFQKSIAISEKIKDTAGIATSYINIGNAYYIQYQDFKAIKYFKEGLQLSLLTTDNRLKEKALFNMAVVAENKKDFPAALKYRKAYEMQSDSVNNQNNVWSLAQQEKKLAVQAEEHKVEIMQQASKLQLLELNKKQLQRNAFLSIAIALLLIAAYMYYVYRQKSKQNKIISAQRKHLDALNTTKNQLFSIVAHDLRSPAQSLKHVLVKLQTALSTKDFAMALLASGEIEEISNGTYALLNNLLYWALSQTEQLHFANDKLQINRMIEQVCYDYNAVAAHKNIVLQNLVPNSMYCAGDMNTIKIIFRNLIDNAIKFSSSGSEVVISALASNNEYTVTVKDSGRGIDDSIIQALNNNNNKRIDHTKTHSQSTGIGLWLAKTMAEKNGGYLRINKELNGTSIKVSLPKYKHHEKTESTYS